MKKKIVIACILSLALLGGCGTKETKEDSKESTESVEVQNPMTEYDSLDEMNEAANTSIVKPGVMGITEEKYFTIDQGDYLIAEYQFQVNGTPYTIRSAATLDEISGYYREDGKLAFEDVEFADMNCYQDEHCKLARWSTIDGQFVVMIEDEGKMEEENFESIIEEMRVLFTPSLGTPIPYEELCGEYGDSVSQRAMMTVSPSEETDGILIVVNWSSSASESTEWKMNAVFSEDGLLSYSDCTKKTIVTDADGNEEVKEEYKDGTGFFSVDEKGKLLWNGAADENCQSCVFEKMPEE